MADFSTLTLAETAAKAKLRQALFRKIKDNEDNLNERMGTVENQIVTFDHFVEDDGGGYSFQGSNYSVDLPPAGWTGTWLVNRARRWMYQGWDTTTRDGTIFNAAKPDQSVARVASVPINASARYSNLYGLDRFRFDRVTRPIIFRARIKLAADSDFVFGLRDGPRSEHYRTVDRPGIWMERVDGSNWRFVCYDGTRNNGGNFAKITTGTWFEVEIEFTDTPADRAFCYVDGVLKQTLTANLPTTSPLCFALLPGGGVNGTAGTTDYDRVRIDCPALLDAA